MENRSCIIDIATCYGLHVSVFEPRWGTHFLFSTCYNTGSGAHTASFAMGNMALFPWEKQPGRGLDHPKPYSAE